MKYRIIINIFHAPLKENEASAERNWIKLGKWYGEYMLFYSKKLLPSRTLAMNGHMTPSAPINK